MSPFYLNINNTHIIINPKYWKYYYKWRQNDISDNVKIKLMKENMRYYCDSSFKQVDDEKWFYLLDIAFSKCNTVEFNILLKRQ